MDFNLLQSICVASEAKHLTKRYICWPCLGLNSQSIDNKSLCSNHKAAIILSSMDIFFIPISSEHTNSQLNLIFTPIMWDVYQSFDSIGLKGGHLMHNVKAKPKPTRNGHLCITLTAQSHNSLTMSASCLQMSALCQIMNETEMKIQCDCSI